MEVRLTPAIEQVICGHHAVEGSELFLVQRHASPLHHLAHLAFAGETLRHFGRQVHGFHACGQSIAADFELRYAREHFEQSLFVQLGKTFLCGFPEKDVAGFHGHVVILTAVYHDGDFLSQSFLQDALSRVFVVTGDETVYFFLVERGEDTDITFGILVGHVKPELVEGVRTGITPVEPNVAFLRLAEFRAVGHCHKRASQGEHFAAIGAAYQFGTRSDVAPLVASAHLQLATLVFI